jgi:predicted amidohydrolase YtcJ
VSTSERGTDTSGAHDRAPEAPRSGAGADAPPVRGTLLVADRVVTLGHARVDARAVLVRGSRVVWVGHDLEQAPPHRDRVDLDGCVLGPAFVDAHVHLTPTGLSETGLDLTTVTSGEQLLRAVSNYAGQHTGRVIWGHGFDPHRYPDELPTPDDLARVCNGRAVYLSRVDGHASLADSRTLASAPLSRAQGVERDADGRIVGLLRREANHIVRRWAVGAMDDDELAAARAHAVELAASRGIGSVHEMGGPDVMGLDDFDCWVRESWPIEVVPYWGGLDLEVPISYGLRQAGGDVFLDGSLGARTAALREPYTDRPGTSGDLELDDDTLTDWIEEATRANLQVGVHAIGDAALEQAARCLRTVLDRLPDNGRDVMRKLRHRIEHAELVPAEVLDELPELGVVASVQPAFEERWGGPGGMYEARLGPERARRMNPYRAFADRGIGVAFGSDTNVTPMDPWAAVHAAEHRRHVEHAVSRLEAVSMQTLGGRSAARQERFVGVVRAGQRADLAAFEGDPYEAEDPRGAKCALTVVQGRVAHGQAPLPRADGT